MNLQWVTAPQTGRSHPKISVEDPAQRWGNQLSTQVQLCYGTISDFQSCLGCLPEPPEREELTGLGILGWGGMFKSLMLLLEESKHSPGLELVTPLKAEQKHWTAQCCSQHSHPKSNCSTGSTQPQQTFPLPGCIAASKGTHRTSPKPWAAEEGHKPGNSTAVPAPALVLQTQISALETSPCYL